MDKNYCKRKRNEMTKSYNENYIKELNEKNINVKLGVRIYKFIYHISGDKRNLRVVARSKNESEYFIKQAKKDGYLTDTLYIDIKLLKQENCGQDRQECLTEYLQYVEKWGHYNDKI